jgi:hypothetical protein
MTSRPARTTDPAPTLMPIRLGPAALLIAIVALGASNATALGAAGDARPAAGTTAAIAPLAPGYQALPVCRAPAPGRARCLAYELAPQPGSAPAAQLSPIARARVRAREQASRAQAQTAVRSSMRGTQLTEGLASEAPAANPTQEPQPITPADLHSAYHLPDRSPEGSPQQTIALVDAYNDPNAEADLDVYDRTFELPECTTASGCFEQVNQNGEAGNLPFPQTDAALAAQEAICERSRAKETASEREEKEAACEAAAEAAGWDVEISTDIDVAHSVCENCRIRLVEAASAGYQDLEAAERTAARGVLEGGEGASEISNSWGGEEPPIDSSAFDHPGIVVTAAAGDYGYLNWTEAETAAAAKQPYYSGADYPASSPHVVAVGGTRLTVTAGGARERETVWNEDPGSAGQNSGAGGGGCSVSFKAQPWQRAIPDWSSVGCGTGAESARAVADVSADGDPYSGVFVYDSAESKEDLLVVGGTSVASPIIAATFALAGGAEKVEYPAQTLYSHLGSASLYDVTEGGNGQCDGLYTSGCTGSMNPLSPLDCGQGVLICNAAAGYDGPTGVGAPNGIAAFNPNGEEGKQTIEEQRRAEERQHTEELLREERRKARELEERQRKEEEARDEPQQQSAGQTTTGGSGAATNQPTTGTGGSEGAAGNESSGSAGHSNATPDVLGADAIRLSDLALTPNAISAIRHGRPAISRVAFAFTLSADTRVRVTLMRQTRSGGRLRWVAEPDSLTVAAHRGRNRLHLQGRTGLAAGRYRLTLAPAHGSARSLTLVLG